MANFENITIEKGMYQQKGKTLTDVLETLDPSENYKGTALSNLDAFSRQLKRFDIKVNGSGSDCVEKFFQSSDSAALFPEYVSRAVRQGMERADILPQIVATVTNIDGMDYRSIESDMTDDDKTLKPVGEGAVIPQTKIKTRENLVKLHKRGRMITPLGASLLHAPEMTGSKIIGFDKNCALEMVQAGNVNTDYDKLIDRQLERAAITCTAGFSKIFADSVKTLSY